MNKKETIEIIKSIMTKMKCYSYGKDDDLISYDDNYEQLDVLTLDEKEYLKRLINGEISDSQRQLYEFNLECNFVNDKEVVMGLLNYKRVQLIRYVSEELRNDTDVVSLALSKDFDAIEYVGESFRDDKKLIMRLLKKDGLLLAYASDRLKDDVDVVRVAIKQNGTSIEYASERFRNDKKLAMDAIRRDCYALEYVSSLLQDDKELVLKAVKDDGSCLEYASDRLRNDKEVVLAALREGSPYASFYVGDSLMDDSDIKNMLFTNQ